MPGGEKIHAAGAAVYGAVEQGRIIPDQFPLRSGLAGICPRRAALLKEGRDHRQAIGLRIWERPEEKRVYEGVDGGVRADAQSQRQNHRDSESWTPAKLAGRVAKVLPERHVANW